MLDKKIIEIKKPSLAREMGEKADLRLIKWAVEIISSCWQFSKTSPANPKIFLLGGFQGSGKTTVTNLLSHRLEAITISPDEIRSELFKKISFSETFAHTVNAVRNELLKKALLTNQHIICDENAIPMRIDLYRSFAENTKYKIITAYLDAPEQILISRVKTRPAQRNRYKGTEDELKVYLKAYGKPDFAKYNFIFNTEKEGAEKIVKKIISAIQPQ